MATPTESAGHAVRVAAACAAAPDTEAVIAVGGDGTVREVATGLAGSTVPLAVMPGGTENLFSKAFGFTPEPDLVADAVLRGRVRRIDLGAAGRPGADPETFTCVAGVGFDAEVLRQLGGRRGHITRLTYVLPMLRSVGAYRWPPLTVLADGRLVTDEAGIVLVFNAPRYALGLQLCPDAVPDDGRLDLVVMRCRHLWDLSRLSLATVLGRLAGRAGVEHIRAEHVDVAGPPGVIWECDGEPRGPLSVEFRVRPAALSVFSTGRE